MDSYKLSKAVFKIVKSPSIVWKMKKMFPEVFFYPHMKPDEFQLFKELCAGKKVFLEYGSGGSTIYLLKNNKDVYSVESNPEFFSYMNSVSLVKKSLDRKLHYRYIDLGPTNKWGKPIATEKSINWSDYYSQIWKSINPAKEKVDVIFIDGRFRVCCCLYSILKLVEFNWKDTTLIIHDFWKRKDYHVVLKFLQEIKSSTTLASFKVKEGVNIEEVKAMLHEYALETK